MKKILEIEVVATKKLIFKREVINLLCGGWSEIIDFFDTLGKHVLEVRIDEKVYHVKYRHGKEVARRVLSVDYREFQQLLTASTYVDDSYKYVFLKKTLRIFE